MTVFTGYLYKQDCMSIITIQLLIYHSKQYMLMLTFLGSLDEKII